MSADDKQIDFDTPGVSSSEVSFVCVNDTRENDQQGKKKHDRRRFLLLLLMLLVASQVILLLASGGLINRTPEPIVEEKPVSLNELKKVELDLKEVIEVLNEINSNPELKDDHVEAKPAVIKPVESKTVKVKPVKVLPVPVVVPVTVKQVKKDIKPKPVTVKANKVALVEKPPVLVPAVVEAEEKTVEESIAEVRKPPYIKYDSKGGFLEDNTEQWTCVHDTKNSLMWEVKDQDNAMRDADNLYSWFNPESGSVKGISNGGRCKGDADCDTYAYVQAMNEKQYCGHSDWRLPTREQMQTLVNFENSTDKEKINKQYFPETRASWYWTSSENKSRDDVAWYVLFRNGLALNDLKERPKHIRLVREVMTN